MRETKNSTFYTQSDQECNENHKARGKSTLRIMRNSNVSFAIAEEKTKNYSKSPPFRIPSPFLKVVDTDRQKKDEINKLLDLISQSEITHRDLGLEKSMPKLKGSKSSVLTDVVKMFDE